MRLNLITGPLSRFKRNRASPPAVSWIGRWGHPPIHVLFGEKVILHVAIGKKHVVRAKTPEIMPGAFGVIRIARPLPRPVALDDFISGTARQFAALQRE